MVCDEPTHPYRPSPFPANPHAGVEDWGRGWSTTMTDAQPRDLLETTALSDEATERPPCCTCGTGHAPPILACLFSFCGPTRNNDTDMLFSALLCSLGVHGHGPRVSVRFMGDPSIAAAAVVPEPALHNPQVTLALASPSSPAMPASGLDTPWAHSHALLWSD